MSPPLQVDLWPFDLESGVRVTCDVGYICANFSLPRPLCSRLRPDVRDRQTSDAHHRLMPPPYGGGSALEALCDYALYKSTFTLHYITLQYLEVFVDDERQSRRPSVHKRLVTPLFWNGFSPEFTRQHYVLPLQSIQSPLWYTIWYSESGRLCERSHIVCLCASHVRWERKRDRDRQREKEQDNLCK